MDALKTRAAKTGRVLSAILLSLVLGACGREEGNTGKEKKPPSVEIETVRSGTIARKLDLSAEVVPVKVIQLSSTVDGPIEFFPWREGDTVDVGEKLLVIERDTYRAEVSTARATLKVAQAKLEDLRAGTRPEEIDKARQTVEEAERNAQFEQTDLERVRELTESGALPGEELDKVRVRWTVAKAKLESARRHLDMLQVGPTRTAIAVQESLVEEAVAKLNLAEARYDECVIDAPFAGTITKTYVRSGDMALARTPLLEMADMDSLVLRFAVPESHAVAVKAGMSLTFELDALPGESFSTQVVRVYPDLDPQMRTRTVEAALPELPQAVSHMFARVRLILERYDNATLVPAGAVMTDPSGGAFVFVASDGTAQRREIETGIEEGPLLQVLEGVKTGESVIAFGQRGLKDGQPVRLSGTASSGGAKGETNKDGTTSGARGPGPEKPEKGGGQGVRGGRQQGKTSSTGPGKGTGQ